MQQPDTPKTLALRGLAFLARSVVLLFEPYWPPPRPGRFPLTLTSQEITPMGVQFKITATLPPLPTPNEVASREITASLNGTASPAVSLPPGTVDSLIGQFPVGAVLSVSLVDIDASGNRSDARVETVTVSDTIPPGQPADFTFKAEQVIV